MKHSAVIDQLERDLRQLHVDFNRYFAGGLELPPELFRDEISKRLQRLRAQGVTGAADRFRLNAVSDRFNALNELFNRRLREELENPTRTKTEEETLPDVRLGILVDGRPSTSALHALYDAIYSGRSEPRSGFAGFRDHLLEQLQSIQMRTGCRRVKLRVSSGDEKPLLKAQPIHEENR
jgi:hypothetical protein